MCDNTLKSEKESTLIICHQKCIHFRLFMLFEKRKKRKWRVEHTVSSSNAVCAWFRHSLCPRLFQLTTFFCLTDILSRQRKIQECSVKKGQLLCQYFFFAKSKCEWSTHLLYFLSCYVHSHSCTHANPMYSVRNSSIGFSSNCLLPNPWWSYFVAILLEPQ